MSEPEPLRSYRCMICGLVKQLRAQRVYCAREHAPIQMESTGVVQVDDEEVQP